MKDALFAELCSIKSKTGKLLYQMLIVIFEILALSVRNTNDDTPEDPQLMRLDNMLIAEGVAGPDRCLPQNSENSASDQADYRLKLGQIRESYKKELEKYESSCQQFTSHVQSLLHDQVVWFSNMRLLFGLFRNEQDL